MRLPSSSPISPKTSRVFIPGFASSACKGTHVAGVVWQQRQAEQARLREAHRSRMSPVYDELLKVIWGKVSGIRAEEVDPEVEAFFRDLNARQLTLGSL